MSGVRAHHGIDSPLPLRPAAGYVRLEGWVFLSDSPTPTEVRLRIGNDVFKPESTFERPDVAAAFPSEPNARQSGFRFLCYPPFGFFLGVLEASRDSATWLPFRTLAVPVLPPPILGAFEKPSPGSIILNPARVEGWCFHPDFDVCRVAVLMGDAELPCEYGLERTDVAALFPHQRKARHAGFITTENLWRGEGRLRLVAETRCGRRFFLESNLTAKIGEGKYPDSSRFKKIAATLTAPVPEPDPRYLRPRTSGIATPGAKNILFVLYGDFTCNSALHVTAIANELIARGYDCVVAGPSHKESIHVLSLAKFSALEFAEWENLPDYFRDGCGPTLVHAWTPRENVRTITEKICATYRVPYFVHLEDNEATLLAAHLQCSQEDLAQMSEERLDAVVPSHLTHPSRAREFLRGAAGVTLIVEQLADLVPAGPPRLVFWPAADTKVYFPRPPDPETRRALSISNSDTVLFYHGNVHRANAEEVGNLYEAVALLNHQGRRTFLIRTGRDDQHLLATKAEKIKTMLLDLGHLEKTRALPEVMRLADYFVQPGEPGVFNDYRFPSKLPEFFSIGRPVILPRTNLGKKVKHLEDAYVLPTADSASIAAAVLELNSNPSLSSQLSAGAVAFAAAHFSWPENVTQILNFYRVYAPLAHSAQSVGDL